MRFAALVSSTRASSPRILFCPAREVTGQTSLLDRAPNSLSLSLSLTHTHARTRVRMIRVCETYACPIRGRRCCSSSTTRPVIGYRPRPTRSTLNSIPLYLSIYPSISIYLSLSEMRSTYEQTAKIYRSITVHDREGCFRKWTFTHLIFLECTTRLEEEEGVGGLV